jgi:hypothetical protein
MLMSVLLLNNERIFSFLRLVAICRQDTKEIYEKIEQDAGGTERQASEEKEKEKEKESKRPINDWY